MQAQLFCFLASYSVAFVLELARLWESRVWLRWGSLGFTAAGLAAQAWYLVARSHAAQLPPLLASMHDWLLVSALLLVSAYFIYAVLNFRLRGTTSLGLFVLPLALAIVGGATLVRDSPNRLLETARFWKMLHAGSLVIGITGVLIGFLLSLMYLLQHRRLKQKVQLQRGISLPPLAALARYNRWMVIFSVPMLTLGLVTGFVLVVQAKRAAAPFTWSDPIVLGFSVVWIGMVALFGWLIRSQPNHGRNVALLTAWAFGFLIVTLVGLQVLVSVTGLPSQHGSLPADNVIKLVGFEQQIEMQP
ncbi:MAG: cytochrome c biogenesis protein CcsA [Planctomycetaceae bacterium]|nr:cytochrome c biogenesis protein CcsA [Planctomycetaceae bacterium]